VAGGLCCLPHYPHHCHVSDAGRVFRLHSSSICVKSSDCRTLGRSTGRDRRGTWWEGGWASAVLSGGTVGTRSSDGFDWALSGGFWRLGPDHIVEALVCCWLVGGSGLGALHLLLCPYEVTSSQPTALLGVSACKSISGQLRWLGVPPSIYGVYSGPGPPTQCPPNSFLWPGFPLSPSGSREAWANLCAVS
jgi:hypothetical protein